MLCYTDQEAVEVSSVYWLQIPSLRLKLSEGDASIAFIYLRH